MLAQDYPLSREEKKRQTLVFYERDVQTATEMLEEADEQLQAQHEEIQQLRRLTRDSQIRTDGDDAGQSIKLTRVVEHWMTHRDLRQALLRQADINDMQFSRFVQVLADCPLLTTLDLAKNHLTIDSCGEICNLIISSRSLSFVSLAENRFCLRSLGYFMTAIMERQNTQQLAPFDTLDLRGNEGFIAAAQPSVTLALWRFLHETGQVRNANVDEAAFHTLDSSTIGSMEQALAKIFLLTMGEGDAVAPVTADVTLQLTSAMDVGAPMASDIPLPRLGSVNLRADLASALDAALASGLLQEAVAQVARKPEAVVAWTPVVARPFSQGCGDVVAAAESRRKGLRCEAPRSSPQKSSMAVFSSEATSDAEEAKNNATVSDSEPLQKTVEAATAVRKKFCEKAKQAAKTPYATKQLRGVEGVKSEPLCSGVSSIWNDFAVLFKFS